MFLGSQHHDDDYSLPLERLGAETNATTDEDRTEYYERVPSNALERALWLEADRMGFLLPAMTQEKLDNERDVVKNERRERVDNVPYGQADEVMREALYPADHPYHHSVIGSMADLSAGGPGRRGGVLPDLLRPGQRDPLRRRRLRARAGPGLDRTLLRPPAPRPASRAPEAERAGARRAEAHPADRRRQPAPRPVDLADRARRPSRRAGARRPGRRPGRPGQGEPAVSRPDVRPPARGQRECRRIRPTCSPARSRSSCTPTRTRSSTSWSRSPTPRSSGSRRTVPPSPEVRKAQNERESDLIMGLQSVTRKAEVFNQYQAIYGDPLAYRTELDRGLRRDAGGRPARGPAVPRPEPDRARHRPRRAVARAGRRRPAAMRPPRIRRRPSPRRPEIKDDFDRSVMPAARPDAPLPAAPVRASAALQRPGAPDRRASRAADRDGRPGRQVGRDAHAQGQGGPGLAGRQPARGGDDVADPMQLAGELAEIGSTLEAAGGLESTTVSLTTLTRHLDRGLDLFADVILNPVVPREGAGAAQAPAAGRTSRPAPTTPRRPPTAVFPRLIYGLDHPYGRPDLGTPGSVEVDHARRRRRVLPADHGAGQRGAGGRRRRAARCDRRRAGGPPRRPGRPARSRRPRRSSRSRHPRTGGTST